MTTRSHHYTRRVVLVMSLAQTEARRMRSGQIHTEHLLLALLREPNGAGAQVLRNLHVELMRVRHMCQSLTNHADDEAPATGGLTVQSRRAMELAGDEARKLGHDKTGTEHILLGLLRESNGAAAMVLGYNQVTLETARAETARLRASGHRIDEALPDREAARTLRAQMVPREGFPYQPREAAPAAPGTFAPGARAILAEAHTCAVRANRSAIGAEHLMLALLRVPAAAPVRILRELGVDVSRLAAALEAYGGHCAHLAEGEVALTAHARQLVAGAVDEARRLRQKQVSAEHFLLSLMRDRQGLAVTALRSVGGDPDRVYQKTLKTLAPAKHEA